MTMHAQPIHALVPGFGPFVDDVPEDRHAERVVQMMLDSLGELTKQVQPQLDEAMGTRIGGSLKAQQRLLERIEGVRAAAHPGATAIDFAATMNDANGAHTGVKARLDDRLGVSAVTYLLFGVKLGPGLALFLVLVFAIWIGWRWLCRKCPAVAWAVWWQSRAELRAPQPRAFDPSPALARAQLTAGPSCWCANRETSCRGAPGKASRSLAGRAGVRLKRPSYLRRMAAGRSTASDFSLRGAATTAFL